MASTYTALLQYTLPTDGEDIGTWGDLVNAGVTQLIEDSVAGVVTLSTDADVTLTTVNGGTDQSRMAIINCTGARGALRNITAPATSKLYAVINATTGGFSVVIRGAGPTTGITVLNGQKVYVAWNGSDFVKVGTSTIALASEVTGTLPVGNGGSGLATLTLNNVVLGNGASSVQLVAPGTSGNLLTSNGTTWSSTAPATNGTVTTVSVTPANGVSGSVATATTTPAITLTLGAITPTTVNGNTITTGSGVLTLAAAKTLTVSNTITLAAGSDGTTQTFQASDTIVGRATTDTLTNKTLTAPTINGGTHTAITSFGLRSTGAAFDLTMAITEALTAGRTLTWKVNDAARTIDIAGNLTLAGAFVTSGAFSSTFTMTNTTTVTFPTTGTLSTLAGTEAFTNKTYNGNTWTAGTGTLTLAASKTLTCNNSITLAGTDSTTMTFPGVSSNIGYLEIPQNSKSAAYTTVLTDSGKQIYHPGADTTARTWTIDSNANVAYPIGTAITFINDTSGGVITIAITSDTMILAGAGSTGSRTLAANGIATAVKMTATRWIISGTGLT